MKHIQPFESFDKEIDLSSSVVTSINIDADCLKIGLLVYLDPSHPHHQAPKPPEIACYRRATLVFCELKRFLARETRINIFAHTDKEPDMGEMHSIRCEDGEYVLYADFGVVHIISSPPTLEIDLDDTGAA